MRYRSRRRVRRSFGRRRGYVGRRRRSATAGRQRIGYRM